MICKLSKKIHETNKKSDKIAKEADEKFEAQ